MRQGLVLDEDNPFRASRIPTRLSMIGGELELRGVREEEVKEDGVHDPFETPLDSPKFMIGEGKWRRPYKGKLRPGMGVQRTMTPASRMDS